MKFDPKTPPTAADKSTGVDRRELVKLGAVGAAAFLQGCREREIAYIEQPVTRAGMPGASRYRAMVCQQCNAGCVAEIRLVSDDAKKLEGKPSSPVNLGGLCALGHSSLQEHYHPDRLTEPMVRRAQAESGTLADYEPVSWDRAFEVLGESLQKSRSAGSSTAIVTRSDGGLVDRLWQSLAERLGASAPTLLRPLDQLIEEQAARVVFGDAAISYDLTRSDLIISFGAPFLDRWRSPVHFAASLTQARSGRVRTRLVQVEPRQSLTAVAADLWLPARPGSEGVLARALAGALLAGDKVDAAAATRYRSLFAAPAPTLEEAARQCDLALESVQTLAGALQSAQRPVILAGGLPLLAGGGLSTAVAALALNLLTELSTESPVTGQRRLLRSGSAPSTSLSQLASRLAGQAAPEIDLLIVSECDPVQVAPGGWGFNDAVAATETVVYLGTQFNDTARHAKLILPLASDLERLTVIEPAAPLAARVLSLSSPVLEVESQARHPGDVALAIATLAETLDGGSSEPADEPLPESFADFAQAAVSELVAAADSSLVPQRVWRDALEEGTLTLGASERTLDLRPRNERDRSRGAILESDVGVAIPDPVEGLAEISDDGFVLLPFESVKSSFDGRGAERPWLQELPDPLSTVMWGSWVEVAASDARKLDLEAGDRVRLHNDQGSVEVTAVINPSARPGTLAVPLGMGHESGSRYSTGVGVNVQSLVAGDVVIGSEVPAVADTRVSLEKVARRKRGEGAVIYGRGLFETEQIPAGWAPHEPLAKGASSHSEVDTNDSQTEENER